MLISNTRKWKKQIEIGFANSEDMNICYKFLLCVALTTVYPGLSKYGMQINELSRKEQKKVT